MKARIPKDWVNHQPKDNTIIGDALVLLILFFIILPFLMWGSYILEATQ